MLKPIYKYKTKYIFYIYYNTSKTISYAPICSSGTSHSVLRNMKEASWINYDTSRVSIEMNLFYPPETIFTFVCVYIPS